MPLDSLTYSPTPVALDADGEILMRAAELVRKRWGQGGGNPSPEATGSQCIMNAISSATDGRRRDDFLPRLGFASAYEAFKWNDAPERTKEEVISRLREAAERGE